MPNCKPYIPRGQGVRQCHLLYRFPILRVEGLTWNLETALRGASERLVPILMTALGLLPLALGGESAGGEIEGPMAIVILGGLITSTALNLLVLPVLALRWGRFSSRTESPTA